MKPIKLKWTPFLFALLLLGSCVASRLTDRPEEIKTFAIDFRKYAEKGFLFTPNEYIGEYQVKGIITAELHPEVVYQKDRQPENLGFTVRYFYNEGESYSQIIKHANMDELIEYIYNLSVEWGGDAFTQFKTSIQKARTNESELTSYEYYSISGLVIKRN